jgi:hypothetical protein
MQVPQNNGQASKVDVKLEIADGMRQRAFSREKTEGKRQL